MKALSRIAVTLSVLVLVAPVFAAELQFRFIGNEAFEITDGEVTLLSDFPYRSGYSIYMTYPDEEIRRRERSVCLITHRHGDHFEPKLVGEIGCRVVAAPEITNKLQDVETLELGGKLLFHSVGIRPIRTPHSDTQHYSYLVEWHGLKLYFVGDTETPEHIPDDLDVLFVSPWLLDTIKRSGSEPSAKKVVIYHHTADEAADCERCACERCVVPQQGETFTIEARSP
jgi:hypothetical protein